MPLTVFYSWQTDSPATLNRNFIESALKEALKQINADATVVNSARVKVRLDKDTSGLPGTPPIVETIFHKIDQCAVFVPDLSFVARTEKDRPTPNANVLIEYGWALKSVGYKRIVPVMNEAFGAASATTLPFNVRHLRWPLRYKLVDGDSDRSGVRRQLADKLGKAIRAVLENAPVEPPPQPAFAETPSTYDKAVFFQEKEALAIRPDLLTEVDERCFVRPKGAKMFLRLLPTAPVREISATRAETLAKTGQLVPFALSPIHGGIWYGRNKYGAIVYRTFETDSDMRQLTQIMKNGEIWGVNGELDRRGSGVLAHGWKEAFIRAFDNYLSFARHHLLLTLPLRIIAGITSIEGFKIAAPPGMGFGGFNPIGGRAFEPDVIFETTLDDWGSPPEEILRPFFQRVWEAFGLEERPVAPGR